jgi:uncharacterized protein (DUF58 family)
MEVTRRYWLTAGVVGLLLLWTLILERPVLLGGAVGVGGWLLTRQYRFVRTTSDTVESLTIDHQLDRTRVTAEETTLGTLTVQAGQPVDGSLQIKTEPPVASRATAAVCALEHSTQTAQTTFEATWPIAGSFTFGQPVVTITDPLGLFCQVTTVGPTPSVTVEPRAPRDIHVGEGGDRIAAGFGQHDAGQTGSGLTPAEVRQYTPGDATKRIDWKATARLNEPHVREFEAETDLETLLIVDHRASMGAGQPGETKLDFGRQVALALVESAQELGDPLGWYGVGDDGLTETFRPSTDTSQYQTVTSRLQALEPTGSAGESDATAILNPAQARRRAEQLDGDSTFDTQLRPFFQAGDTYVQRIANKPLFSAIQAATTRHDSINRTVIITDDTHKTELREAVEVARQGNGQVTVFLTPSVLYESQTIGNLDDAYQRYTDFETFRQELSSVPRVSAFEVGPGDQLASVLSAGREQQVMSQ